MQPIPLDIIHHVMASIFQDRLAPHSLRAAGNLIATAYFFLMRPGEYCNAPEAHPFRFQDVSFAVGTRLLNSRTSPEASLLAADSVVITYNDQKNANRGEKVGQGRSGDPNLCPVIAAARLIIHLRRNAAPDDTPIYTYYSQYRANPKKVASATIADVMRRSARMLGYPDDIVRNIHARALRATGASALLLSQIDTNLIRLLGRWKSDAMLLYLHAQTAGITHNFAQRMITPVPDDPLTRHASLPPLTTPP